jgi:hypothetical protein
MDVYWRVQHGAPPWDAVEWERKYLRTLRDHHSFATTHGKPVSYPEWGLSGADVPQFIDAMHDWLSGLPSSGPGSLLYHSYFDGRDELDLDSYPRARDTFQRLFGD